MRENAYQKQLIKKIESLIPGAIVLKNNPAQKQGIPDLLVLTESGWGMLEVKTSDKSPIQPNQEYWVDRLGVMGFSSFIWPDIEEEVLRELQQTLKPRGTTCVPES